jgi:outer membrane protein assembly factor BamB
LKGRVFAGSADGRLYAFDAGSGELLWSFKTKDQILFPPIEVIRDLIVIAAQDQLDYALNSEDGTLRWRHALGSLPHGEPCVADETVFVGTTEGFICALNAHSGRLEWKHKPGGEKLKAGPVVTDSYLYAANDIGSLICLCPLPRA